MNPLAHDIVGLKLTYLGSDAFVRAVADRARGPAHERSGYCCVPNAHQCVEAYADPRFRAAVNAATFRIADSKILDLSRRFLHGAAPLPTRKGADLLLDIARAATAEGVSIGFFGGSPETLAKLVERLTVLIPGCRIGYAVSPPFGSFGEAGDPTTAAAINASGIGILFVGLGCPKQEWWMFRNRDLVVPFMIGVGAAFDFVAGTKRSSPDWVHRVGLEWLYRFAQEPRRLWRRYLLYAPLFIWLVLKQKVARTKSLRGASSCSPVE